MGTLTIWWACASFLFSDLLCSSLFELFLTPKGHILAFIASGNYILKAVLQLLCLFTADIFCWFQTGSVNFRYRLELPLQNHSLPWWFKIGNSVLYVKLHFKGTGAIFLTRPEESLGEVNTADAKSNPPSEPCLHLDSGFFVHPASSKVLGHMRRGPCCYSFPYSPPPVFDAG